MLVVQIILAILGAAISFVLLLVLALFVGTLTIDAKKLPEKDNKFWRKIVKILLPVVVKVCRIDMKVTNMEIVPENTKFLLVCNHRSNFDPIVTWYAFRDYDIAFVSKEENFKIPIAGRIMTACCSVSIDRVNPRNAMKTINKAAELIKQDEVSYGIYPEGTRSKTLELLEFHNGVFKIAQKANVPVIVSTVRGTENVHKNFPFKKTEILLDILSVIPAEEVKANQTSQTGEKVRQTMEEALSK